MINYITSKPKPFFRFGMVIPVPNLRTLRPSILEGYAAHRETNEHTDRQTYNQDAGGHLTHRPTSPAWVLIYTQILILMMTNNKLNLPYTSSNLVFPSHATPPGPANRCLGDS